MARKRMISPEFWTDATMVALPFEARLLYIGMWNFADDYGYLADEPDRLALQILPADDVDIETMIDLLVVAERLARYEAEDGTRYLHIRHFGDHQKVDHPSASLYANREGSRKLAIPNAVRRAVAVKYGCPPGGEVDAECYYCGAPSQIRWWPGRRGQAGYWVTFGRLELDHFEAESAGGTAVPENLVLACQPCNRSKGPQNGVAFVSRNVATIREDSRGLARAPESRARAEVSLEEEKLVQEKGNEEGGALAATAAPPAAVPKPNRTQQVIDLLAAEGVEVHPRPQDGKAIKDSGAKPEAIVAVYLAIFRDEFGDKFMRDNLSLQSAIGHLDGYRAMLTKAQVSPRPGGVQGQCPACGTWKPKGEPCGRCARNVAALGTDPRRNVEATLRAVSRRS